MKNIVKPITNFSEFKTWKDIDEALLKATKEAGFVEGSYVRYKGKASKIKEFCTGTWAIERKQRYAWAYLDEVYQDYVDVNKLELISEKEYKSELHILQRLSQKQRWKIKDLEDKLKLYEKAFEKLKDKKEVDSTCCNFGPCLKSKIGLCDGECDYAG